VIVGKSELGGRVGGGDAFPSLVHNGCPIVRGCSRVHKITREVHHTSRSIEVVHWTCRIIPPSKLHNGGNRAGISEGVVIDLPPSPPPRSGRGGGVHAELGLL
jgi:hypothetical protein